MDAGPPAGPGKFIPGIRAGDPPSLPLKTDRREMGGTKRGGFLKFPPFQTITTGEA